MALSGPTALSQVKRHTVLSFSGLVHAHVDSVFNFKIYELGAGGVETLTYTSNTFVTTSKDLEVSDTDDSAAFTFAAEDNKYYKIQLIEQFPGSDLDEFYVHTFPDDLPSQAAAGVSLDSTLFQKLLMMLGHNVLAGELANSTGYTTQVVRRGYDTLTDTEAATLLAASDAPGDVGVIQKSKLVLTTSDVGNETQSVEVDQTVS